MPASDQLQPWKSTKTKESIRATVSPQSLCLCFKSICDQEAAALAVVKRPYDHATLMTTALLLNFAHNSMEGAVDKFELINAPGDPGLTTVEKQPPVDIDLVRLARDYYDTQTARAGERKRRISTAKTKLSVVTALLEYRTVTRCS
jgi:hypothetical protein